MSKALKNKNFTHETVLLHEAVKLLITNTDGCYVDGTFGRGGHSRLILNTLTESGRLLGIDRDDQAIQEANSIKDSRFEMEHGPFSDLAAYCEKRGWSGKLNGVLLDLGVSSPQLDDADRGFSFLKDGPLDMRMDQRQPMSAATWIAQAEEKDIAQVLFDYGDERFGRRMAKAIVKARQESPIETTGKLAQIIKEANPAWEKGKHPATRAFQAIRIKVNGELDQLEKALDDALEQLAVGGRLVIISFHSLEDRMVKRFMRKHAKGDELPKGLPIMESQLNKRLKLIGKALKPSAEEIEVNQRSRSSILRVAEKIA